MSLRTLTLILDIFMVTAVRNSQTVRLNKDSWYNGTLPVCHVIYLDKPVFIFLGFI